MAKRSYNMTSSEYGALNKKLIPYNIIIMCIALVCTIMMFFGSFWKFTIKYTINEDFLKNVVGVVDSDAEGSGTDVFSNLDYSALDGVTIKVGLDLKSETILASIGKTSEESVKELVLAVTKDLSGQVKDIVKSVLKASMQLFLSSAAEGALADANLSGLDGIVDKMFDEGLTSEDLESELMGLVNSILDSSSIAAGDRAAIESDMNAMVEKAAEGLVETLGDETGKISVERVMFNFLGEALGVDYSGASADEVVDQFAATLVNSMDSNVVKTIHIAILVLAIILIAIAAVWALLFLFTFIHMFTKKKGVYLGNVRGVGWIPFTILVILPAFLIWLLRKVAGNFDVVGALNGLSVTFFSMTIISFIGVMVITILNWCGYKRTKRKIKYSVITDMGTEFSNRDYNNDFNNENDTFTREEYSTFTKDDFDKNDW